jgi:predicted enzyme related to lactoylglutathione lyase
LARGERALDKVKGFDVLVDDMRRTSKFYNDLFGWEVEGIEGSGGDFHSARTLAMNEQGDPVEPGGINGGFFIRGTNGLSSTFLAIRMSSIDVVLGKVVSGRFGPQGKVRYTRYRLFRRDHGQ